MLAGLSQKGRDELYTAFELLSDQEFALVDDIEAGYELIEKTQLSDTLQDYSARICALWLTAWEQVKAIYTDTASIDNVRPLSGIYLAAWVDELEIQLHNAGIKTKDREYFKQRLTFCQEVCAAFPESNPLLIHSLRRSEAESWFFTGHAEQGEAAFVSLVKDFPDNTWGYIGWGDMYNDRWLNNALLTPDYEKAKALYRIPIERGLEDAEEAQLRLDELEDSLRLDRGSLDV